ncbi:MAG: hypothetical protein Cons2KO_19340 [Congregibacter sp.]
MNQFQVAYIGSNQPQCFDQAELQAAPTMNGEARRLIQRHKVLVFKNDAVPQALLPTLRCNTLGRSGCDAKRRDAYRVSCLQAPVGLYATFVQANLALTKSPVDACFWHSWTLTQDKIVDSLPDAPLADGDKPRSPRAIVVGGRF